MFRTALKKVFTNCTNKFKYCNAVKNFFEKPDALIVKNSIKKEELKESADSVKDKLKESADSKKHDQKKKKTPWVNWTSTKTVLEAPMHTWNALVRKPRRLTKKDFETSLLAWPRFSVISKLESIGINANFGIRDPGIERGKPRLMTEKDFLSCNFDISDILANDQIKMETYFKMDVASEKVVEYISRKLLIALKNTKFTINIRAWPKFSVTSKLESIGINVNPFEIWYEENLDNIKRILNQTTGLEFDKLAKDSYDQSKKLTDSVIRRMQQRGETIQRISEVKYKDIFESESDTMTHMTAIVLGQGTEFVIYEGLSWNAKHARMLTNEEGVLGLTKTILIFVKGRQVAKLREEHKFGHDSRLKELKESRTCRNLSINSLNYEFKCTSISIYYDALITSTNELFVEDDLTRRYKNFIRLFVKDIFFEKNGELSSFKRVMSRIKGTELFKHYRNFIQSVVTDIFYDGSGKLPGFKKVMYKIKRSRFYCSIILFVMMLCVFSICLSTPTVDDTIESNVILVQ